VDVLLWVPHQKKPVASKHTLVKVTSRIAVFSILFADPRLIFFVSQLDFLNKHDQIFLKLVNFTVRGFSFRVYITTTVLYKRINVPAIWSHRCGCHPALTRARLLDSLVSRPIELELLTFGRPNGWSFSVDGHFGLVNQLEGFFCQSTVSDVELSFMGQERDAFQVHDLIWFVNFFSLPIPSCSLFSSGKSFSRIVTEEVGAVACKLTSYVVSVASLATVRDPAWNSSFAFF